MLSVQRNRVVLLDGGENNKRLCQGDTAGTLYLIEEGFKSAGGFGVDFEQKIKIPGYVVTFGNLLVGLDKLIKVVVIFRMLHAHGDESGDVHSELFAVEHNGVLLDNTVCLKLLYALYDG